MDSMSTRALAAALLAALAFAPLPSHAHVTVEPSTAQPNATTRLTLRVPHGCEGAATHTLRVVLPEGSSSVLPMPKAGWTLVTVKQPLDEPLDDRHGGKITDVVRQVIWTGGRLDHEHYDEFVVRFRTPNRPGATLPILATQDCEGGKRAPWTEVAREGQRASDLKYPAPLLRLTAGQ